jgi:hypothetical protein
VKEEQLGYKRGGIGKRRKRKGNTYRNELDEAEREEIRC